MDAQEFPTAWERQFGALPPVVYQLKDKLEASWFTVPSPIQPPSSSLSESEQAEILHQQNAVLTMILGLGGVYHLVRTTVLWRDIQAPHFREEDDSVLVMTLDPSNWSNYDPGECLWQFRAKTLSWEPRSQDRLLILAAEDRESNLMFIRDTFDGIVAPRPRGLEVYAPVQAMRATWQNKLNH